MKMQIGIYIYTHLHIHNRLDAENHLYNVHDYNRIYN